jgi:AbrB family looped-hinge helix DNA binding protein
MAAVTVSPKYQVVIPREVREAAQIKPGTKLDIVVYNGQIKLIPIQPLSSLYGSLKGIDTNIERDEDRY